MRLDCSHCYAVLRFVSYRRACVCVRGRRWRCSRISVCLCRLCGQFYGAAGYWAGKRGLDEHRTVAVELKNCISCHTSSSSPIQVATTTVETRRNPPAVPDAPSPSYACHYLRSCTHTRKSRHRHPMVLTKDKLNSRWKAFRNACRHPKHHRVVERVVLHLRHKHDKMD